MLFFNGSWSFLHLSSFSLVLTSLTLSWHFSDHHSKNTTVISWLFLHHHTLQQRHRCYFLALPSPPYFAAKTSLLFLNSFHTNKLSNKNTTISLLFSNHYSLQQEHRCYLSALPLTSNFAEKSSLNSHGSFFNIKLCSKNIAAISQLFSYQQTF